MDVKVLSQKRQRHARAREREIRERACELRLFGQHLWKNAGKRIVIVEGEIDALSVFEAMPNWPVVSLPNGAQSAKKAIKNSLEFLESYERVVLLFDMDEPGQKAVEEVAEMFSPGKCAGLRTNA